MEDGERGRNRVQDVCQKFRILEDQTVAHVLQEQEIQQHLAANEQKSQRVRENLRVARRLQEEEDEWSRQLTRRLRKQIEDMEGDSTRITQEDNGHRQSTSKEASNKLHWFARETARQHEEEDELATESDEGFRSNRARSRKPYVGRAMEDGAGWDEDGSRREGVHRFEDGGCELGVGVAAVASGFGQAKAIARLATEQMGRYQSPTHGLRCVKETQVIPRAFSTRSEDQLERDRTRPCVTERTQQAVNGIERDDWKRQCRLDWSYTDDSEYLAPKPTMAGGGSRYHVGGRADSSGALPSSSYSAAIAHPVFTNGEDLAIPRRCASDSESQPRPRKHKRDGEGARSWARSEVSHRPARVRHNRKVSPPQNSQRGNRPETVRHKHRSQGHHRREHQTDYHSELGLQRRAKDLRCPLDPKERLKQDRQKEENGHHPLAVKEKEKEAHRLLVANQRHAPHPLAVGEKQAHRPLVVNQKHAPHSLAVGEKQVHQPLVVNQKHAPHPLAVDEKQAHRPLVVNQKHAPHPLAVGEKPVHSPVRSKVKEKQVHFLLDPAERVKPAHCPLTNKEKPLALKGKESNFQLAGKQKRIHFPLAVEEHVQNPLVVKEKDVQYPLAGKEKKNPARCPLAVKGNPIQYRLGSKDTETIIDYVLDKRKESGDSSSPKHVGKSPPAFGENGCPEKDRGKPVEPTSDKTRLLPSQPAGDIRENHAQPMRLHAEKDPAGDPSSNWPKASAAHMGGSRWRGEPSQRATNDPKAVGLGQVSSQRREPHRVRAHVDNTRDRPRRSKADRSNTPSPLNRQQNKPRAGEQRGSETRKDSPSGRPRTPRNGVTVPTWCNDKTLKNLQAIELRKAQMRKANADKKLAQLAQDEEFALDLLRKELMALRMSEGQKEPGLSQTGEDSAAREKEECPRSCSPHSMNVDWPDQKKVPKSAYF